MAHPYDDNIYFILLDTDPDLVDILTHTVEDELTAPLWDGSYIVKLPMNVAIPVVLQGKASYTHAEMVIEQAVRDAGRPDDPE